MVFIVLPAGNLSAEVTSGVKNVISGFAFIVRSFWQMLQTSFQRNARAFCLK